MPRMSMKAIKEREKANNEKRSAFLLSLTTKDAIQQALEPPARALLSCPPLDIPAYHKTKNILLRAHQILEPEDFYSVVDHVGIDRSDAMELVHEAIKSAAQRSVSAPFFEYSFEIVRRIGKLAREKEAEKYNQDIFRLKVNALSFEYKLLVDEWRKHTPDEYVDLNKRMMEPWLKALEMFLE